jgi:hypothetical protein
MWINNLWRFMEVAKAAGLPGLEEALSKCESDHAAHGWILLTGYIITDRGSDAAVIAYMEATNAMEAPYGRAS